MYVMMLSSPYLAKSTGKRENKNFYDKFHEREEEDFSFYDTSKEGEGASGKNSAHRKKPLTRRILFNFFIIFRVLLN
jgi:hypothetical protein